MEKTNQIIKTIAAAAVIGVTFISSITHAQQTNPKKLPPCPKDQTVRYDNCFGTFKRGGDVYIGEFKDNKKNGQGTYIFANGDKYVGEYKDGVSHGQGTYTWADGNRYVGEFKDDKRSGQGIFTANGDKYVGEYREDKRNGQGTFTWANGDKYIGEFKDNQKNGLGMMTLADVGWHYGEWLNNIPQGQGIRFYSDSGKREEGIWADGYLIREAKVNLPNLNNNIATSTDRTDIDRERQQLAEERRRLEEEKRRLQQNNQRDNAAIPTDNRRRFALVIGNANYSSLPKLQNAINDARAMTQALRSTGFSVATHENLDLTGMQNAVRNFGEQLGKNDVGLIFFAGHGVQVKGKNYLVPVRENIKKSFEVPSNALDVDLVLATLENVKNDLNIVVLDACRSPFPGESRGASRGLATLEAGKGIFVAFSTSPGKEASDGSDANSPYTKNLSRLLTEKGLSLEKVFKEVRKAVVSETNGEQIPWENSSLMGDFYFKH